MLYSVLSKSKSNRYLVGALKSNRLLSITNKSFSSTDAVTPETIINDCFAIRSSIQTINDRFKGPLEKSSQKNTILPFVFLLGNHSSGKSSFINYVCQRKVQTAGVAPTDDSFTAIVPGPADIDKDGPACIGDPELGLSQLRAFGPPLVHHTKLKIRSNIAIKNFMIVDTPGMIDSPMIRDAQGKSKYAVMNRGYDFEGVCRWYAERADVILLFFDPDKPGTTGETLSILTNSLVGLDHKLLIVLNKADQFRKIHDFARAYGSLCWNLSKVIQRKDLPLIYTMCLPTSYQSHAQQPHFDQHNGADDNSGHLSNGLADLELSREEVVREVLNAPKRRVDNEISRLNDSVALLQMHLNIVDDLSQQYRSSIFRARMLLGVTLASASSALAASVVLELPTEFIGTIALGGIASSAGMFWWQSTIQTTQSERLVTEESMKATFERLYARRLVEKDEFTTSLWVRVLDHLVLTFTSRELVSLGKVKQPDTQRLEDILEIEIPNLRRKAAPTYNTKL